MRSRGPHAIPVALLALTAGCALLGKGEPGAPRFFRLDPPLAVASSTAHPPSERDSRPELRLGRITGPSYLDEELVVRDASHEVGYHRDLRWTEPPDRALERWLARALFEGHGLRRVVGGAGPTLDVELLAFDELRAPRHAVRVELTVRLHDERLVVWEGTLAEERAVAEGEGDDAARRTVEAFAAALAALVERVAAGVKGELAVWASPDVRELTPPTPLPAE